MVRMRVIARERDREKARARARVRGKGKARQDGKLGGRTPKRNQPLPPD